MAEVDVSYNQIPQEIKALLYRVDIRSRYIQSIVRETANDTYVITLKQKHRISDTEFELDAEALRYLYRDDTFISIQNPDRREGLKMAFRY